MVSKNLAPPVTAADGNLEPWSSLPEVWRQEAHAQLHQGEQPIDSFEPDLNSQLDFANGVVLLTDRRLLALDDNPATKGGGNRWQSWNLSDVAKLKADGQGGMGTLEVLGQNSLLKSWRYTAARNAAAAKFVHAYNDLVALNAAPAKNLPAPAATVCPSCGVALEIGQTICPSCTPSAAPPPVRSLWRLMRFARPRAGMIVFGFVLTLSSTAAGLVPPYLTMPLLNKVLVPYQAGRAVDFSLVKWYLSLLFGAAVLAWILSWAKTYVMAYVSEQISADLRHHTYAHLQRLSLEFFGGKRTGDLISRVSSDTDRVCSFLSVNLLDFATDVLMVIMTAGILIWLDPWLAIVTLLPFPLIAWLTQRVRIRLRHGFARGSTAWAEMVNVLADTIPGIRVVKAFAQEQREIDRFDSRNQYVLEANTRVNMLWSFFGPTVTLLTDCGMLVIWAYGAYRVAHDYTDVGVLIAFIAYMGRLYVRLDSMSRMLASTQRAGAATHRIFEILDRVPSVAEPVRPIHPGRLEGNIELRNVSFKYGNRPVIRDVSLSIEPGQMIGLVGPSGSGKSTLVNLVCRFYDVAAGGIYADGTDIRSYPVEEYRRNIGIVLQEPFLFYGTIAENIAYARPEATRAEIIAAARASRAHEFILKLADGYDSLVGERGQALSGGERQRISIARALLTDPRILILDEATSSVDTETEREIQEALENLVRGRTTIAIAHRLSTLRRANKLVVLEDGQITGMGTHDELMENSGTYIRLQQAQLEMAHG